MEKQKGRREGCVRAIFGVLVLAAVLLEGAEGRLSMRDRSNRMTPSKSHASELSAKEGLENAPRFSQAKGWHAVALDDLHTSWHFYEQKLVRDDEPDTKYIFSSPFPVQWSTHGPAMIEYATSKPGCSMDKTLWLGGAHGCPDGGCVVEDPDMAFGGVKVDDVCLSRVQAGLPAVFPGLQVWDLPEKLHEHATLRTAGSGDDGDGASGVAEAESCADINHDDLVSVIRAALGVANCVIMMPCFAGGNTCYKDAVSALGFPDVNPDEDVHPVAWEDAIVGRAFLRSGTDEVFWVFAVRPGVDIRPKALHTMIALWAGTKKFSDIFGAAKDPFGTMVVADPNNRADDVVRREMQMTHEVLRTGRLADVNDLVRAEVTAVREPPDVLVLGHADNEILTGLIEFVLANGFEELPDDYR